MASGVILFPLSPLPTIPRAAIYKIKFRGNTLHLPLSYKISQIVADEKQDVFVKHICPKNSHFLKKKKKIKTDLVI